MKTLPSRLFPNCSFSAGKAAGFYDIVPDGFDDVVSLYLGAETVQNDEAIARAAAFFDRANEWNDVCRNAFINAQPDSEDFDMIEEYFTFYKDEAPEVFGVEDISGLSLSDMVRSLKFTHMGTQGSGTEQRYNVDFTLGFDQLLCVYFDSEGNFDHMAWES